MMSGMIYTQKLLRRPKFMIVRKNGISPAWKYIDATTNLYQNFLPHMGFVNIYPIYADTITGIIVPNTVLATETYAARANPCSRNIVM